MATTFNCRFQPRAAPHCDISGYFNSTNALSGETNSTLTLSPVTPAQAGTYDVAVANAFGSVTSAPAHLQVFVIPTILCSSDLTVALGTAWAFTAPAYSDTNLTLQLLGTSTNILCAESFSATRQWLVSDTNGYQLTCSQTVQVLNTNPPLLSCAGDKSVVYGNPWTFDVPLARDAQALETLAYDNWSNALDLSLDPGSLEIGNQVTLQGSRGYLSRFALEYWGTNSLLGTLTLAWDPSTDPSVVGYRLYQGGESQVYTNVVDVGAANTTTITGLAPGATYYFALTAYDANDFESAFSGEISYTVPSTEPGFAGPVSARVRFYQNDGPALDGQQSSPGTLFYDSGPLPITATNRGALVLQEFSLSAAVPLVGSLPSSFTWTVQFAGLGSNDAAGLNFDGPPVAGQVQAGYWAMQTNGWSLQGQAGQAFAAQISTLSSGTSLTVLSTVTNAGCARSFSATRTWQALDACGNANTCSQTVSVLDQSAPLLVSQPQDQSVLAGNTVTLAVTVSSCPPIGYQWYFNLTNVIPDATNASLVLESINSSEAGLYSAVITNAFGSITSSPALVTVNLPAVIVGNPVDQVATNGDDVHWRVLAKGSAPLYYQWYFEGTNSLPLQTNSTLDLLSVTPDQAGIYQVVVTNVYGSATSAPALLTIVVPPAIITGPTDLTVTNGDTVRWAVIAQGTAPLSYQWFFDSTLLGLETNSTLVMSNIVAAQAGVYRVAVANAYGSITSAPANLLVFYVPPITCSSDSTVPLGSAWDFTPPNYSDTNLTLQVLGTSTNLLCSGSYTATRQWLISYTNGYEHICQQTVSVLDPSAPVINCPADKTVLEGNSWSFDVPSARESGASEAVVYDNLTNGAPQTFDTGGLELGDEIVPDGTNRFPSRFAVEYWATNSSSSSLVGTVTARVRFYANDGPIAAVSVLQPGTLVYDSGPVSISATNSGILELNEFQLTAALPLVQPLPSAFTWTVQFEGLGDADSAGLNTYVTAPLVGQADAGDWLFNTNAWTLQTGVQSFGAQLAALSRGVTLSVVNTSTNIQCPQSRTVARTWQALDSCSNAVTCSQAVTIVTPTAPAIVSQPQDQSAALNQTVQLSVAVSSCPPLQYQWFFDGSNALATGTSATLVLPNVTIDAAGAYQAIISNDYGSVTSAPAVLTISGAPVILTQPIDTLVAEGGTAQFTVTAEASPDPSYQWYFQATNLLAGETASSLILTNVQPAQSGSYSVVISNSAGTITSSGASLTIVGSPLITLQPQSITNFQGQSVTFTVSATGSAPLSYQWMANCSRPISGATAPSLRLKSVGPADSGTYCVVISNAFGTVLSQPAVLRVLVQPRLVTLVETQSGATFSFSTVPNLLYSVYFSDTLPGTTWTLLPNMFRQPGTGSPMTVQDPGAPPIQRFYRILVE